MALAPPAPVRPLRQRRPGRQFDFAYWSHFDARQGPGNPGASDRRWLLSDRGSGTPPPGGRRPGGGGGSGGSAGRRGRIPRLIDLLAVGFRYGAPWAWTVYTIHTSTEAESGRPTDSAH